MNNIEYENVTLKQMIFKLQKCIVDMNAELLRSDNAQNQRQLENEINELVTKNNTLWRTIELQRMTHEEQNHVIAKLCRELDKSCFRRLIEYWKAIIFNK